MRNMCLPKKTTVNMKTSKFSLETQEKKNKTIASLFVHLTFKIRYFLFKTQLCYKSLRLRKLNSYCTNSYISFFKFILQSITMALYEIILFCKQALVLS